MSTNPKSVCLTTRTALLFLKQAHGTILNPASMVGRIGQSVHTAYSASKGWMIALTKLVALDYAAIGIRVNAVSPTGQWTPPIERGCGEQPDPRSIDQYRDGLRVLGNCPRGDAITDAAVLLPSEKGRFMTGCILRSAAERDLGYRP
ncbi:MAG TPA: SDR family oxidoreductase [Bryobacteraceae bacterium]|nr:SDR family oxidoreductase [Bryobacteraceae bacterium]